MKSVLTCSLCVLALLASGCNKKSEASPAASAAPPSGAAPTDDGTYALTTDAPECKVGATCVATLRLEAKGDYHLNPEYPFKFTAGDNTKVEYLGSDPGGHNVFTKAAGDFAKQTE